MRSTGSAGNLLEIDKIKKHRYFRYHRLRYNLRVAGYISRSRPEQSKIHGPTKHLFPMNDWRGSTRSRNQGQEFQRRSKDEEDVGGSGNRQPRSSSKTCMMNGQVRFFLTTPLMGEPRHHNFSPKPQTQIIIAKVFIGAYCVISSAFQHILNTFTEFIDLIQPYNENNNTLFNLKNPVIVRHNPFRIFQFKDRWGLPFSFSTFIVGYLQYLGE